jgi:hypothetical protein
VHVAYGVFWNEAFWAVCKFFDALFNAFCEFFAADWAYVAKFYGFFRRKRNMAVSVACPVVFSVGGSNSPLKQTPPTENTTGQATETAQFRFRRKKP